MSSALAERELLEDVPLPVIQDQFSNDQVGTFKDVPSPPYMQERAEESDNGRICTLGRLTTVRHVEHRPAPEPVRDMRRDVEFRGGELYILMDFFTKIVCGITRR